MGNLRLKIFDAEVSFADEPPGIQVCFETGNIPPEQAERIVQEICENAFRITQIPSQVIVA